MDLETTISEQCAHNYFCVADSCVYLVQKREVISWHATFHCMSLSRDVGAHRRSVARPTWQAKSSFVKHIWLYVLEMPRSLALQVIEYGMASDMYWHCQRVETMCKLARCVDLANSRWCSYIKSHAALMSSRLARSASLLETFSYSFEICAFNAIIVQDNCCTAVLLAGISIRIDL